MTFEPRPYQVKALNEIWQSIQENLSTLAQLPTGAGKTIIFSKIIQRLLRENPSFRVLVLVDREVLVRQTADKLCKVAPELALSIGFYCASVSKIKDGDNPVTIASRQTLINGLDDFPFVNLIILDEAHLCRIPTDEDTEDDKDQIQKTIEKLRQYNPKTRLFGCTATPYRLSQGYIYGNKNTRGCLPYFPELNHKTNVSSLMADGFLCQLQAKTIISQETQNALDNVKLIAGEYSLADLAATMMQGVHIKTAVETWKEHASDRKKTLAFCVTIDHAEMLAAAFNEHGIPAIALHSKTEDDLAMGELEKENYKIFTSVAKLTTGLDVPDIDCILACRATKSTALWLQMVGRGLRNAEGKTDCLCLDLVGNFRQHGTNLDKPKVFYRIAKASKKKDERDEEKEKITEKQCEFCAEVVHVSCRVCPECGAAFIIEAEQAPDLTDVIIGPQIRRVVCTGFDAVRHLSKSSGKELGKLVLNFVDEEAEIARRYNRVYVWLCFKDFYEGFAVRKMKETFKKLNRLGLDTPPDSVTDFVENASFLIDKPDWIDIDFSGKYPELKGFGYYETKDDDLPF